MLAPAFLIVGFLVLVAGLALWSIPLSLVIAGLLLFLAGGLEMRNS